MGIDKDEKITLGAGGMDLQDKQKMMLGGRVGKDKQEKRKEGGGLISSCEECGYDN